MSYEVLQRFASRALPVLLGMYVALIPFSGAFVIHTAPWLLLGLWLMEGQWESKWRRLRACRAVWFWLAFLLFSALSVLWSDDLAHAAKNMKHYWLATIPFVVVLTSLDARTVRRLITLFLGAMFVSEIVSYGLFFGWWHFGKATSADPSPVYHHIHYSVLLALTVILLLDQIVRRETPKVLRILETLFLLSTTANLFLNGGRTGQLALLVGVLLFFAVRYGVQWRRLAAVASVLGLLYVGAYELSPNFRHRVQQAAADLSAIREGRMVGSMGQRLAMLEVSRAMVQEHPWLGVGVGDDLATVRQKVAPGGEFARYRFIAHYQHLHNQYIQVLVQSGPLGLALFVGFFIALFSRPVPAGRSGTFDAILGIYLSAFLFEMIFYSVLAPVLGLFAALFIVQERKEAA